MTARDLYAHLEMTQRPLGPASFARFRELGIPDRVIFGVRPLVGVARIVTSTDELFEFHDEGDPAIIVVEGEPEVPGWAEVDDLIAFKPGKPGDWWLRRGAVKVLGAYNIAPKAPPLSGQERPLTIHETPLSWLRAGATGICVLDWTFKPASTLLGAGNLEAESARLKALLEDRIKQAALEPFKISVTSPTTEMRHAA